MLVTLGRFFIVESANWLLPRATTKRPRRQSPSCWSATRNIRRRSSWARTPREARRSPSRPSAALFNSRNRRATIFASVPWFIQDLGTYGIGIFTPTILAAALGGGADHIRSVSDLIAERHPGRQGRGADRLPADRRHRLRRDAGRQGGPHQAADLRLHRLRRWACCWPRSRSISSGEHKIAADLRRLHDVQLHDQYRPERADLPAGG